MYTYVHTYIKGIGNQGFGIREAGKKEVLRCMFVCFVHYISDRRIFLSWGFLGRSGGGKVETFPGVHWGGGKKAMYIDIHL
jgi:hypothetical protein